MFCVNIKQIEKNGGSVVHKNINFDTRSFTLIPIKIVYNFWNFASLRVWQLGKASTGLKCFPLEEWFKSRVDQFGSRLRSACIYIKDFWLQSGIVFLHLFLQSGIVTPSRPAHCQAATPFSHLHLQRWKWERVRNQLTFICRDGETSIFGINIWLCACKCGILRF